MNLNINAVIQSGIVKWPALRYGADGKPEFRFTLTRPYQNASGETGESEYPCCAVSATAEKLAADLDEGMFVVITAGELVYRKRETKYGEVSRLEILVWRVQMGDASPPATPVAAQSEAAEGDPTSDAPARAPEPKARKPRYPKWKPTPAHPN